MQKNNTNQTEISETDGKTFADAILKQNKNQQSFEERLKHTAATIIECYSKLSPKNKRKSLNELDALGQKYNGKFQKPMADFVSSLVQNYGGAR